MRIANGGFVYSAPGEPLHLGDGSITVKVSSSDGLSKIVKIQPGESAVIDELYANGQIARKRGQAQIKAFFQNN